MDKKYSLGLIIYSIIVLAVALGVCIYQKNNILLTTATITGITYVILTAKVNKYGFLFGIVNILLYGSILFNEKIYAGAIYNVVYAFPMLIYGYVKYVKDEQRKKLDIKSIDFKNKFWQIFILVIVIIMSSYILSLFESKLGIIDSITTILGIVGIYLLSNRYKEQWIVWIIVNLMNTVMWIILTIENIEKLPILIMWAVYLVNSVYGMFYWRKLNSKKG